MLKKIFEKNEGSGEPTSRRSFFVDAMSWGAGLWIAASGLSLLSGCSDTTAKYGGPPQPDGSSDQMVSKYGGPSDMMPEGMVGKYGGPPRDMGLEGPVAKYGGPPPRDMGREGISTKYGGPPRDMGREGISTKYGGPKRDV